MTYPFIGKFQSAVKIFFNHGSSAVIESGHGVARHESNFKNITAEYLANTYGEVKSKEHAEFIVKLATENNIKVWTFWNKGKCFNFHADQNGGLNLEFSNEEYAKRNGEKLITIPLPPKQEDEKMNTKEKTSREKLLEFMHECYHRNESDFYTFSQEFVDHIEMKESTDLGWPKIGSKVTWADSTLKGEVASIGDCVAWVKKDNGDYETVFLSLLNKPKTPEQELRDELTVVMQRNLTYEQMVNDLIENFNITKKPQ